MDLVVVVDGVEEDGDKLGGEVLKVRPARAEGGVRVGGNVVEGWLCARIAEKGAVGLHHVGEWGVLADAEGVLVW
ncbi:hypothetical protein [Nereida ignava]|uniref:hypothetical protein n=1 Tax=Nereida ignava TaxID=282199 RepID=UPI0030FC32F0